MRRTALFASLVLALLAASIPAAQPAGRVARIGYLSTTSLRPAMPEVGATAFQEELAALGWVEDKNLRIENRYGPVPRFPELARELVALDVDLIVAGGGMPGVQAARDATTRIPIVALGVADQVVRNLARPEGNITGVTTQSWDISEKRVELLREAVPHPARLGVLWEPDNPGSVSQLREIESGARKLGVELRAYAIRGPADLEDAFRAMTRDRVGGVVIPPFHWSHAERHRLAQLALQHRLPALFGPRHFAEAGGLMAFGANLPALLRRAAHQVDRLLRGAKPGDVPVEQPTKFDLVINLRTAKALGLTIPPAVLVRADEVLE